MAFPRGKFVKVNAIRISKSGKVDVKVPASTARKLTNPSGKKGISIAELKLRYGANWKEAAKYFGVKVPASNPRRRKRNIAAGFYDEDGYFHPIRASYDYSPGRAGEKARKAPAKKKKAKAKRKR